MENIMLLLILQRSLIMATVSVIVPHQLLESIDALVIDLKLHALNNKSKGKEQSTKQLGRPKKAIYKLTDIEKHKALEIAQKQGQNKVNEYLQNLRLKFQLEQEQIKLADKEKELAERAKEKLQKEERINRSNLIVKLIEEGLKTYKGIPLAKSSE
jgi:hypothetical protein